MVALAWSLTRLLGALVVHLVYRRWITIVGFDLYLLLALGRMASPRPRPAVAPV